MSSTQKYLIKLFILTFLFMMLSGCSEAGGLNFQSVLQNLARSYPNLWRLVTATAYVIGFMLALKAVYQMKLYGEARAMSSSGASIKGPLAYMLASTMLIASPTAFHIVNYTFFGTNNPLSYTGGAEAGISQASIVAVIGLVQIIGLIAFVRGWMLVARLGEQSGQPGQGGKALTHIIGGAFAINVIQVKDVLWNTFGFG